ncbi:MAG: ammonium transporter [Bauldia sp.]|nr:ammonium transporter [Bauldia sp.]
MNRDVAGSIAWGGGIVVLALAATGARQLGWLDEDAVIRIVVGAIGLMIAWYGNRMPKVVVPVAWYGKAARVGGWSMFLSGLVYAAAWIFAPIPVAVVVGCGAVAAGVLVTVGYSLSLRAKAKAAT